jgi:tetratricopeptide (TPR) repeat protein
MSLLLDALKRAEDAKRAKASAAAGATPASDPSVAAHAEGSSDPSGLGQPPVLDDFQREPSDQTRAAPAPVAPELSMVDFPEVEAAAAEITQQDAPPSNSQPVTAKHTLTLEDVLHRELGIAPLEATEESRLLPTPAATAAFRTTRVKQSTAATSGLVADTNVAKSVRESAAQADIAGVPREKVTDASANKEAIKNAFAVKQAVPASSKAKWALPLVAVVLAAVGSGGWYVWNEMNRFSKPTQAKAGPPSAPKPSPTKSPASAKEATPGAPAELVEEPLPPLLPPEATQVGDEKPKAVAVVAQLTPQQTTVRRLETLPGPAETVPAAGVRLRLATTAPLPAISPVLAAGYAALASADYALAKRRYAEAIASDPNSVDANLGFATAAARSADRADTALAIKHYQRVLEIDPRNSTARAALIVLADPASETDQSRRSSAAKEAELRLVIAQDPAAANAHFLLGNLYAEERRWNEAQVAFFEAARLAPQSGDYLFNLAVSLDQLGQARAAADFYRRALAATLRGQFDRAQVERRITTLATVASDSASAGERNPPEPSKRP